MAPHMVSCAGDAAGGSLANLLLRVWQHWQITILLIVSATLQLTLVLAGFLRKRVLSRTFHGLLWLAFLGMEASSVYALGLMLASGCDHIFSLWAPLLLFHMGAADAINAYAPADNELWRRSAFKMLLSLLATAFILSRTHECERYMPAGVLLAIVGTFKYVERVYCLRQGSTPEILVSARPIYNFMQDCANRVRERKDANVDAAKRDHLLVAGEWQWYKDNLAKKNTSAHMYIYYSDIQATLEDFAGMQKDQNQDLCLAYALFKIYRRRLSNLHIHSKEEDYDTVRKTLFSINNLIKVIDLEMSFIFDGVFTKAAGAQLFHGIGLITRLLSALLLLIALLVLAFVKAMQVGCSVNSKEHNLHNAGAHGPLQELTCLLIVVGILVECLQIYRHVRCNSFRVWLVYTYITEKRCINTNLEGEMEKRHSRPSENASGCNGRSWGGFKATSRPSAFSIMIHTLAMKGILALLKYGSTAKTSTHWRYNVGQRSILRDILSEVFMHFFVDFQIDGMRRTRRKEEDIMELFKVDEVELQEYLIKELVTRCKDRSAEEVRTRVAHRVRKPLEEEDKQEEGSFTGIEEVVLHCHVATSMCELKMLQESGGKVQLQSEHQKLSIWLSRYCLYLMLKRHKLIPEDPDMAASLYARVKHDLCEDILRSKPPHEDLANMIDIENPLLQKVEEATLLQQKAVAGSASTSMTAADPNLQYLDLALGRASKLLLKDDDERWKSLADVWVDIVIYIAATENATPHTEQMAKGGELLTLLWVVIGHLGISQNV